MAARPGIARSTMRAQILARPGPIADAPLALMDRPVPIPAAGTLLIRVRACGVCHTDLHIVEGDLPLRRQPVTPGHQAVGLLVETGAGVTRWRAGQRVGVAWLHTVCGECEFCLRREENLCDRAMFTGWDVNGGYAEYLVAAEAAAVAIPDSFDDVEAAPLLCAGIIGYRSLIKAEVGPGDHVGLFGFGASAHLALQVARHWGCRVSVFTRSAGHRTLAAALGADWTGPADSDPPRRLDRAILFAPAGRLVPVALGHLRKGGVLAVNAIHLSPIPEFGYNLLYGERTVRSVTNATYRDAEEFMQLAARIPIKTEVTVFPLAQANVALQRLERGEINGAAVLVNEP